MYPLTKKVYAYTFLLFGFNLFLKGLFFTKVSFSGDEPFTFYHALLPVKDIVSILLQGNNPPAYEVFMHYWMRVFGTEVWALRLPSLLAASAVPALWFALISRFYKQSIAFFVALMFTFLQEQWIFSQEMRAYALCFFMLSLALFLLSFIQEKKGFYFIFSAALLTALAVYTHYLSVLTLPLFYWVILKKQVKPLQSILVFSFLLAVLLLPFGWILLQRLSDPDNTLWGSPPDWKQLYGQWNTAFNFRFWIILLLLAIGLLLPESRVKLKQLRFTPESWRWTGFLGVVLLFLYLSVFVFSLYKPMFQSRYLSFLFFGFVPVFAIFISSVLNKSARGKYLMIAMLIALVSGLKFNAKPDDHPERVASLTSEFKQEHKGAVVLLFPEWYGLTLAYHSNLKEVPLQEINSALQAQNIFTFWDEERIDFLIRELEPSSLLYIDAGEYFLYGEYRFEDRIASYFPNKKVLQVDRQVRLIYFAE